MRSIEASIIRSCQYHIQTTFMYVCLPFSHPCPPPPSTRPRPSVLAYSQHSEPPEYIEKDGDDVDKTSKGELVEGTEDAPAEGSLSAETAGGAAGPPALSTPGVSAKGACFASFRVFPAIEATFCFCMVWRFLLGMGSEVVPGLPRAAGTRRTPLESTVYLWVRAVF